VQLGHGPGAKKLTPFASLYQLLGICYTSQLKKPYW
jgi:hypothetical protein